MLPFEQEQAEEAVITGTKLLQEKLDRILAKLDDLETVIEEMEAKLAELELPYGSLD